MPFLSNSKCDLTEILTKLDNLNLDGIVGFPDLNQIKGGTISLTGERQLLVPSEEIVQDKAFVRELVVSNSTEEPLLIFLGELATPIYVYPKMLFRETFNKSSIHIQGKPGATIDAIVKSNFEIYFDIGVDEMPVPVAVRLILPTGGNYEQPMSNFWIGNNNMFAQNLNRWFNSVEGVTGHLWFVVEQFQMGKPISFEILPEGTSYYPGSYPFYFEWINLIRLQQLIGVTGASAIEVRTIQVTKSLDQSVSDEEDRHEFVDNKVTIQPSMSRFIGRIIHYNSEAYSDSSCIITNYSPNSNTLEGGTFTLGGF